ncbi:hypothetical protein FJU30_24690 [Affinibrenneria salicis]|uniref:Uncharacterized protein n=1 Tax=Affinibrenneria salicis TaxID=2590031 RepID=A0A5J5FRL2_9GAMM|nr:hypothetical protein [Affinibrenneria salicis]KAA8995388.1 hypothetical protein FJU30_24690 [Affinibrenneria salicis]
MTAVYPQAIVAEFLQSAGYHLHIRRPRVSIEQNDRAKRVAVLTHFPPATRVSSPAGGYKLWIALPPDAPDSRTRFAAAKRDGISIAPGHFFSITRSVDRCLRLNAGIGWSAAAERLIRRIAGLRFRPSVDADGSAPGSVAGSSLAQRE